MTLYLVNDYIKFYFSNLNVGTHKYSGPPEYMGWRKEKSKKIPKIWFGQDIKYLINVYK